MHSEPEAVIEVDFTSLDAEDRVVASLRFSNRWQRPEVGDWVRLMDAEGNSCIGRVEELRNLIVAVRPDWGTWTSEVITHPYEASSVVAGFNDSLTRLGS
jgi:hypothetical protein